MSKLFLVLFSFMVLGCAQKPIIWDRQGASQEKFNKDNGECLQSAQVYTPPVSTPQPQGQMVSGRYVAPSWTQQLAAALNNSPGGYSTNQSLFAGCMRSRGYIPSQNK